MGEENSSPMEVVQRKMLEYKQQDQLLQHAQYGKTGSVDPLEWIIPETSWHDETQDVLPSEYSSDNKKENKEVKKSSQKRIKHYCSVGVCTTLARKVGGKCVRHGGGSRCSECPRIAAKKSLCKIHFRAKHILKGVNVIFQSTEEERGAA